MYQTSGSSECPHYDLWVNTFLNEWLALLKKLSGQQNNTCSSIANLTQCRTQNEDKLTLAINRSMHHLATR